MNKDHPTNIASLPYSKAYEKQGDVVIIKDYDDAFKVLIAEKSAVSDFTVFVAFNFFSIYGITILHCIVAFTLSLINHLAG